MTSVNTNAAAITALRTLQQTNNSLDATQARISTGLKIGEAKDNAAYWAISTTLKSDNKSLGTVKDALGLGAATVDVAYQGLNKSKDVLDEIKAKLTAATQPGVDRDVIQAEIGELQKQLVSIASSSVFSGENWLSVDSSTVNYDATKKIVASFARDTNNSVQIGTVDVSIGNVALFDASTVPGTNGILDTMQTLTDKSGVALTNGGIAETTGNTNAAGLATAAGTSNATIGATNGMNAAGTTGAVAGAAAASANGSAAVLARAKVTAAATYATNPGAANDRFSFDIQIDGGTAVTGITTAVLADNTIGDAVSKIQAAINASSIGSGKILVAADGAGTSLTFTSLAGNNGTASTLKISNWLNTITAGNNGGMTNAAGGTGTTQNGSTVTPAGSGTLNATLSNTGLADGDVITVSYQLGNPAGPVLTKDVTVTTASSFNKSAFATAWGSVAGTTAVANGSTASVDFTDTSSTGTTSKFTITDVVVKSSVATGSVIKNIDPLGGITGSKATSVSTASLTWPSSLATGDLVKVKMAGNATVFSAAAGTTLDNFITNLNTSFAGAFTASKSGTSLVITAAATGVGTVAVESIGFTDSAGAAKSVTTTGLGLLSTSATRTTADFSTFTLDSNDTLNLSVQVGTGTAKAVKIDQALVNATLGASAAGAVTTAADFKRVVDAAMTAAGVTGVTTALGTLPADVNKLVFTGTLGQSLTIAGGTASQGGMAMSVDKLDISDTGLAARGVTTSADIQKVLSAYISVVNTAINKVTTAASNLGAVASRIDMQKSFVNTLMDTIDKGVGGLIDADMSEESTKLQALQVKQQLGVQALSIANQSAQSVLSLFRG